MDHAVLVTESLKSQSSKCRQEFIDDMVHLLDYIYDANGDYKVMMLPTYATVR